MGGWQTAPDQPGPSDGGGPGQTNRNIYAYCYVRQDWNTGSWVYAPNLQAMMVAYRAAPSMPTATLMWHYGVIKYEDETQFVSRTQTIDPVVNSWDSQSWIDKYVLIEIYRRLPDDSLEKLAPDWVGKIVQADPKPHGQGNTREVSGEMVLTAKGLAVELDQTFVDSNIREYAPDYLMRSFDAQPFNLYGAQLGSVVGNRNGTLFASQDPIPLDAIDDTETETIDLSADRVPPGGIYVFGDGEGLWTGAQVAHYLAALPRQCTVPFLVADPFAALTNLVDKWDLKGMSRFRALCELINPRRGLGFYISCDDIRSNPGGPANIIVFTGTDVPISSGGQTIPANATTINFLQETAEDIRVDMLEGTVDSELAFDIIEAVGERLVVVGSFGHQDDTLDADWSSVDELAYRKGCIGAIEDDPQAVIDFLELDYAEQLALHDAYRQADRFENVFSRLRFSGAYPDPVQYPRLGDGRGCLTLGGTAIKCSTPATAMIDRRQPWMPRVIDGGLVTTQHGNAPAWPWGKRFGITTPLVEGYDYSEIGMDANGDAAPYDIPPSGEPKYRPPFVLVPITDGEDNTKYYYADRLSTLRGYHSAHLKVEPTAMGVSVVFPFPHYAAGATFRAGPGELTAIENNNTDLANLVTVLHISGYNGEAGEVGTLTATSANELTWTPPSGGAGPAITINQGETKAIYGQDPTMYVVVDRISAGNLTGTLQVTCPDFFNAEPSGGGRVATIDWKKFILTASFEADQKPFVRARTNPAQSLPNNPRIARIEVKGAEIHWMHPSCVVDVNQDGELMKAPFSPPPGVPQTTIKGWRIIRNDKTILQQQAAFAAAWYGKRQRPLRISWQTVEWPANIGDLVKQVAGLFDMEGGESNTPVTSITLDLVQNTTTLETSYMELDSRTFDMVGRNRRMNDIQRRNTDSPGINS